MPINFAMHKIKQGTRTAGTAKSNFKGAVERFVSSDNAFSFMSSVKTTLAYRKQFLYDVLATVKQLRIPTYFLTFSCADLRWEEELKKLSYQDQCNLLNNNPVLVARHFSINLYEFSMHQIFKIKLLALSLLKKQ